MSNQKDAKLFKQFFKTFFKDIKLSYCLIAALGSTILAFGLRNVHAISNVTEGGILGLVLLFEYWFNISPAISNLILNTLCYITGIKIFGRKFLIYSTISTLGFSASYSIFESFEPVYPEIANMPVLASLIGAVFVGVGAGLCVKIGGAPSGDDALAMSFSKILKVDLKWIYLLSDLSVLLLSLSYIPLNQIVYSLLTVILSGQIIGIVQKFKIPEFLKVKKV